MVLAKGISSVKPLIKIGKKFGNSLHFSLMKTAPNGHSVYKLQFLNQTCVQKDKNTNDSET